MFESLTEAQWVGFSFVLLGMALIGGMLVLSIGSLTFGIASAATAAGLMTWGVVRKRRP